MPPTTFATDIRMLLCEHCGAPLEATIQGGSISCGFCNATNIVQPRLDRFESVPSTQLSESERLARLRMQQGPAAPLAPSIAQLVVGATIPDYRMKDAFDTFQATRRELKRSGSVEASERLYVLTHVVVDTLLQNQDTVRIRTVLETALESVVLERHRTCLRAMLARHAIREGDLDSARQWLAGCDPRSDNLGSDSEYRLSQALLATARGDPAAVVSILGRDENDIPIAEALADDAAVLRADAYEQHGDVGTAIRLLFERMGRSGVRGRRRMAEFARIHATMRLVPTSLPQARLRYVHSIESKVLPTLSNSGCLVFIGFLFLGLSSVFVYTAFIESGPTSKVVSSIIVMLVFAASGLGMFFLSAHVFRTRQRLLKALRYGIPAYAQVQTIVSSMVMKSGAQQAVLALQWRTSSGMRQGRVNWSGNTNPPGPGDVLAICYDPEDPKGIVLDPD
ncbi:MAG TPA: hypothetical protein PLJ27_03910 [Polyangiaceae bacterium]|jgi:hypothetical protein|nr:MAG: hypothetical protein BWY17_00074 [Deltaproteobacteria bacterium ADurb.Bin207]HNS97839.1 hypothetical protein [Polyangiaceae bacterium]HNZ20553.1 hypothetical protein [Polyangiaceae bacterium]HOD20831.1 hypothetical protein [Polyangiaceae bacterium]HOE47251.1 hypothetical protein [Polyangiaceae bacterium]